MERRGIKHRQPHNDPLFIKEAQVKELLEWVDCVDAMESALVAATNSTKSADKSFSSQTSRSFTSVPDKGVLLTMPGFIGNYSLNSVTGHDEKHSTLACKLVTSFSGNYELSPPLPTILATILLFNANNGSLRAVIEATEITAWRTASVSLVATKHLFSESRRLDASNRFTLAVCGTGAQVIYEMREIMQFVVNDINLSSALGSNSCAGNARLLPKLILESKFVE